MQAWSQYYFYLIKKSDVMYNLGNKSVTRKTMIEANVPVIPGSEKNRYMIAKQERK